MLGPIVQWLIGGLMTITGMARDGPGEVEETGEAWREVQLWLLTLSRN